MTENKHTPAFPVLETHEDKGILSLGLTKREKIAAMALQGLLANPENKGRDTLGNCAFDAVSAADCLLTELSKS